MGDADSAVDFGFCLEHGLGVDQNLVESVRHYRKAADRGSPSGRFQLSLSLHYGIGCDVDLDEAASFCTELLGHTKGARLVDSFRCLRALNQAEYPGLQTRKVISQRSDILHHYESTRPFNFVSAPSGLYARRPGKVDGQMIGTGGASKVTVQRDPTTGKRVAVKHIWFPTASFMMEVESLAKLNHPCILRIVGWRHPDSLGNAAQIHTEYAPNGSLARLLTDSPSPLSISNATRTAIIICGIVLGMRYIHLSGLIHRDLKPANILLNEKHHPLIGDFGSSLFQADDVTPTFDSGTIRYAAPEQYGEDAPTPKSDVFSFGLVLYELLVGSPVFSPSERSFSVIRRLRKGELPVVPGDCGFFMQELIARCWAHDPDVRPSFHQILWEICCVNFAILPNAAPNEIQDFCDAIVDWERKAGIPQ
jgi:hypothetical protein